MAQDTLLVWPLVEREESRVRLVPPTPDLDVEIPGTAILRHTDAFDAPGSAAPQLYVAASGPRMPFLAFNLEAHVF